MVDQPGVAGLDGEGEFGVGQRIFVAAIDRGVLGQGGDLEQGVPHDRHGGLIDLAAADGEERVSGEEQLLRFEEIHDVADGVAGRFDDPRLQRADARDVAFPDGGVDERHPVRLARRGQDAGLGEALLHLGDALHMVPVAMGHENVGEGPAALVEGFQDRRGLGNVDGGGGAGRGIMDEDAEIVGQAGELMDLSRHRALQTLGCES